MLIVSTNPASAMKLHLNYSVLWFTIHIFRQGGKWKFYLDKLVMLSQTHADVTDVRNAERCKDWCWCTNCNTTPLVNSQTIKIYDIFVGFVYMFCLIPDDKKAKVSQLLTEVELRTLQLK